MIRPSAALIALAVIAGLAVYPMLSTESTGEPIEPSPEAVDAADSAPARPTMTGVLVEAETEPEPEPASPPPDIDHRLYFPDGSYRPALNGAYKPSPLRWPRGVAYAPVIRTEREADGTEYYVHANGFRSTTVMKWREDLGRYDCITRLAEEGRPNAAVRKHRLH